MRFRDCMQLAMLATLLLGCSEEPPLQQRYSDALLQSAQTWEETPVPSPEQPAPQASSLELALWALLMAQDADAQSLGDATAALFPRLDPVWGGLLERSPDASEAFLSQPLAIRLATQGHGLAAFATAYWVTGERRFLNAFQKVDTYVQDWLRLREGGYSAGQRLRPPSLRPPFTASDYWQLRREHDRRQLGIPRLADAAGTAALIALAHSYLIAADAFAEPNYASEAQRLVRWLIPDQPALSGLDSCSDLAAATQLLLTAYSRSRELELLNLAEHALDRLFAERAADPLCETTEIAQGRSALARGALAQSLLMLSVVEHDPSPIALIEPLLASCLAALPAMSPAERLVSHGYQRWLNHGFLAMRIAGQPDDPRTLALADAARASWHPRKLLVPTGLAAATAQGLAEHPALYVCSGRVCQGPLTDPEDLAGAMTAVQVPVSVAVSQQLRFYFAQSSAPEHQ